MSATDVVLLVEQLLSPRGQQLLERVHAEVPSPQESLRVAARLRAEFPADLISFALLQQELRVRARGKFTRADSMLFTRPGYEQATSEAVAAHRAGRYVGAGTVFDLCCGIGGDSVALGAVVGELVSVDIDPVHLSMTQHNTAVYDVGDRVQLREEDVRSVRLQGADALFVDPARRHVHQRLHWGESQPPLSWCISLVSQVPAVGIKAVPGLPKALTPAGWEAEFVAVGRELKECVLWSPCLAGPRRRATILPLGHTLTAAAGDSVPVLPPGEYLIDPNPAVTRASLVEELARQLSAWKIDQHLAFLSADSPCATPFGRVLKILESMPWREKDLGRRLGDLGIGVVDIRRRGLAGDVEGIRRRLKLTGAGVRATLVMTRAQGQPWALICTELDHRGTREPRSQCLSTVLH